MAAACVRPTDWFLCADIKARGCPRLDRRAENVAHASSLCRCVIVCRSSQKNVFGEKVWWTDTECVCGGGIRTNACSPSMHCEPAQYWHRFNKSWLARPRVFSSRRKFVQGRAHQPARECNTWICDVTYWPCIVTHMALKLLQMQASAIKRAHKCLQLPPRRHLSEPCTDTLLS